MQEVYAFAVTTSCRQCLERPKASPFHLLFCFVPSIPLPVFVASRIILNVGMCSAPMFLRISCLRELGVLKNGTREKDRLQNTVNKNTGGVNIFGNSKMHLSCYPTYVCCVAVKTKEK